MESLEKEVLEVVRQQPERNPDGELWRLHVGIHSYSKAYILENWRKDEDMRKTIVKSIINLKLHTLSRGTRE